MVVHPSKGSPHASKALSSGADRGQPLLREGGGLSRGAALVRRPAGEFRAAPGARISLARMNCGGTMGTPPEPPGLPPERHGDTVLPMVLAGVASIDTPTERREEPWSTDSKRAQ